MTRIERHTGHRHGANAGSALTNIDRAARIAIITRSAIGFGGAVAATHHGIAGASQMATIDGHAIRGRSAATNAAHAHVVLRAGIRVRARRAIGFGRVRAHTRGRITNARIMTCIRHRTNNRVCPDAHSGLTSVRLRARIAVIAGQTGQQRTTAIGWRARRHGTSIANASVTSTIATHAVDAKSALTIRAVCA